MAGRTVCRSTRPASTRVDRGRVADPAAPTTGRGGEDLAVLMFTSGTSGRPRAAMLSHRALLANLDQCRALEPAPMSRDDVVLLVLPLFHVYGLNAGLGHGRRHRGHRRPGRAVRPGRARAALVRDDGVTNVPGAPRCTSPGPAADACEALRGVRLLASGRARCRRPCSSGCGRRAAAPSTRATGSPRPRRWSRARSLRAGQARLGRAAGARASRCGCVDGDGSRSPRATPARSWCAGRTCSPATGRTARDGPDADGWLATGDVAYADGDGDLFLVDRRKELVLVQRLQRLPA